MMTSDISRWLVWDTLPTDTGRCCRGILGSRAPRIDHSTNVELSDGWLVSMLGIHFERKVYGEKLDTKPGDMEKFRPATSFWEKAASNQSIVKDAMPIAYVEGSGSLILHRSTMSNLELPGNKHHNQCKARNGHKGRMPRILEPSLQMVNPFSSHKDLYPRFSVPLNHVTSIHITKSQCTILLLCGFGTREGFDWWRL